MIMIKDLHKKYNGRIVISGLNLEIEKKKNVTVFAPSGSGKTTLINILNGLDKDYSGSVKINASDVSTVFQEPRLFNYMTVRENILLPFNIHKGKNDAVYDDELYKEWLSICGLKDYELYYPYEISGGMKQKAGIIRGFLLNPSLIFLDEPFKSIDIKSKIKIADFIGRKYENTTIFFVTHSLDDITLLSDNIIVFKDSILEKFSEIKLNEGYDLQKIYDNIRM